MDAYDDLTDLEGVFDNDFDLNENANMPSNAVEHKSETEISAKELSGLEDVFNDEFDLIDTTHKNNTDLHQQCISDTNAAREQTTSGLPENTNEKDSTLLNRIVESKYLENENTNDKQSTNGEDDKSVKDDVSRNTSTSANGKQHINETDDKNNETDTKEYTYKQYSRNASDIESETRREYANNSQDMDTDDVTDTATENGKSANENKNETNSSNSDDKQTENANKPLRNENQCQLETKNKTMEKEPSENDNENSKGNDEQVAGEVLDKGIESDVSEKRKNIVSDGSIQTFREGTEPNSDEQTAGTHIRSGPTKRKRKIKIKASTNISEQQSSSDDDQTLAEIARQSRKQQHEFDQTEHEDLDDPAKDPDFKVKKKDLLASESDSDTDIEKPRRKKKKTKNQQNPPKKPIQITKTNNVSQRIRDKAWKKKSSQLSKNKRKTPGRPKTARKQTWDKTSKRKLFTKSTQRNPIKQSATRKTTINDLTKSSTNFDVINANLERAKVESLNTYRVKQVLLKFHERSLDTLLNSNGLRRKTIEGDGNCFFSAVREVTPNFESPHQVRKAVVDHLQINKAEYISFLSNTSNKGSHRELQEIYDSQVEFLKGDRHWSTELCDLLPLAIANMMGREVIIYSSNRNNQLIEIQPTLTEVRSEEVLTLAYIALKGYEHYDICISHNQTSEDIPCSEEFDKAKTPEKERTETTQQATPNKTENVESCEVNAGAKDSAKKRMPSSPTGITPRKRAKYVSPEKKKRSRKRKAHPENWKKNVRKQLRLSGKEYINAKGQKVDARSLKPHNCQKCRYKCGEKISEVERTNIFKTFWSLGNNDRQRDFICKSVMENDPQRIKFQAKTRRKKSRIFSLVVGQQQHRVCKSFFMKTLDLGEKAIEYAVTRSSAGVFTTKDKRGQHTPHNKTPDAKVEDIKSHIESFPVVEGHYTRKDSKRQYLGSDLNTRKCTPSIVRNANQRKRKLQANRHTEIFSVTITIIRFMCPKRTNAILVICIISPRIIIQN